MNSCTFSPAHPPLPPSLPPALPPLDQGELSQEKVANTSMSNENSQIRKRKKAPKRGAIGSPKPARKTRAKRRKPKYLSLKLELFPQQQKIKAPLKPSSKTMSSNNKQQLNLFPLHPENLVQDDKLLLDMQDDYQHVASLFETATDTSTSLHNVLDTTTTATTTITTTSEDGPLSSSPVVNSLYKGHDRDHEHHQSEEVECGGGSSLLVRTAMRCKERDASEERWVSYWEVVKKEPEEVSSGANNFFGYTTATDADALGKMLPMQGGEKGLVGLKLDYQEILNAWSDKGSFYIEGESPQIVPDLHDTSNGPLDCGSCLWRVPEMEKVGANKSGQREASVLRYLEKRQSRLFSRRIRYEVRKLNAEKRPRLKGRFVKRTGEV